MAPEGEAKVSRCTDIPGYRECGEPERTATKYFTDVAAAFWGLYINGQDSNHGPTVGGTGAEERNGSVSLPDARKHSKRAEDRFTDSTG